MTRCAKTCGTLRGRRGQAILYFAFAILALACIVAFHADLYAIITGKNRIQNAGDAAALAAAHVQGRLLNEIGRLNLARVATALKGGTEEELDGLERTQRRLALLGPLTALQEADAVAAAKPYGLSKNDGFAEVLTEIADELNLLSEGSASLDTDLFDPLLVAEYAGVLRDVAARTCVGPDNIDLPGFSLGYLPYNKAFYEAVNGRDWCWFFFHAMGALSGYRTFGDWGPPPDVDRNLTMDNSPIFSLGLSVRRVCLSGVSPEMPDRLARALASNGFGTFPVEDIRTNDYLAVRTPRWYFYDTANMWNAWDAINPDRGFPAMGHVLSEYGVNGAAAVCRVVSGKNTWLAAARPFGTVDASEGEAGVVTALDGFVVPAFDRVRLIPIAAASGGSDTADVEWVRHLRKHVGTYLETGPSFSNCSYCKALRTWETASFRQAGITWLELNSGTCRKAGGSGGPGGGTRYAH